MAKFAFIALALALFAVASASRKCGHAYCTSSQVCVGHPRRCVTPMTIGKQCGQDPYWVCVKGLKCKGGRCVKEMSLGGQCGVDPYWTCKRRLSCVGHRCVRVVGRGRKCGKKFTVCAKPYSCKHTKRGDRCVVIVGPGGSCYKRYQVCKPPLMCMGKGRHAKCMD